jgi:hypothetical protein
LPSITCSCDDVVTSATAIFIRIVVDRGDLSPKRVRESWGMFLLFLLRLRAPQTVPLYMPRVARITAGTVEVAPRRSGRTRTVVNYAAGVTAGEHEEPVDPGAESPLTDLGPEGSTEPPPKKKRRRRAKATEPVVYDIPAVETKTTTFKGMGGFQMSARSRVNDFQVVWDTCVLRCLNCSQNPLTVSPGLPEYHPPHCETGPYLL